MILNTVVYHMQIQPFSNTLMNPESAGALSLSSQDVLSDENRFVSSIKIDNLTKQKVEEIGIESLAVEFEKKCTVKNPSEIGVHDLCVCNLIRLSNGQEFLIPSQILLERSVYIQKLMAECADKRSDGENIHRGTIDIDLIDVFGSADEIPEEQELAFFFEVLKNPSLLTNLLSANEEPDLNHAFDVCFVSIELASYFQSDEVLKTADTLLAKIISGCLPERGGYHQLLWYARRHKLLGAESKCLDGVLRECLDDSESMVQVEGSLQKFLHLFL